MIAYKLFKLKEDGNLYPLYINLDKTISYIEIGKWYDASAGDYTVDEKNGRKYVKANGGLSKLAYRPGWHSGSTPYLNHIGIKHNGKQYLPNNFIWAEVEISDTIDYQEIADNQSKLTRDKCLDYIPSNGFYRYKTSPNASSEQEWYISGSLKVNKLLTDEEAFRISNNKTLRNCSITKDFKLTDKSGIVRKI